MTLKLYYHPLSSFCHKVLIALYENDTPFEPVLVDFGNPQERAAFNAKWPVGKFPLLEDGPGRFIPESTVIIDWLDLHHPGRTRFVSPDPDVALAMRLSDRFMDNYVHYPMQKIVGDVLRPEGRKDPQGVEDAKAQIAMAYDMTEKKLSDGRVWAMGDDFSLVDCASAPALFYANKVVPFGEHKAIAAYLERLSQRPSYARVLKEAEPYFQYFPVQ